MVSMQEENTKESVPDSYIYVSGCLRLDLATLCLTVILPSVRIASVSFKGSYELIFFFLMILFGRLPHSLILLLLVYQLE